MRTIGAALLGLALAGPAWAAGGGGAVVDGLYMPRYGRRAAEHDAPGFMGCLGLVGYGAGPRGRRFGGQGQVCRGRDVRQVQGGVNLGVWHGNGFGYVTAYSELGVGTFFDGSGDSRYRSLYGYLKPTVAIGKPIGITAFELGLFMNVPVNFVQWVHSGDPRGFVTPSFGVSASWLWGDFRGRRPPPPPPEPPAPPPPVAPPPAPPPSRPLAIPAG